MQCPSNAVLYLCLAVQCFAVAELDFYETRLRSFLPGFYKLSVFDHVPRVGLDLFAVYNSDGKIFDFKIFIIFKRNDED